MDSSGGTCRRSSSCPGSSFSLLLPKSRRASRHPFQRRFCSARRRRRLHPCDGRGGSGLRRPGPGAASPGFQPSGEGLVIDPGRRRKAPGAQAALVILRQKPLALPACHAQAVPRVQLQIRPAGMCPRSVIAGLAGGCHGYHRPEIPGISRCWPVAPGVPLTQQSHHVG